MITESTDQYTREKYINLIQFKVNKKKSIGNIKLLMGRQYFTANITNN